MAVTYSDHVLADLDRILKAISKRSRAGAKRVSLAIERTVELCGDYPFMFALTAKGQIRRCPVAKFRYTVYFRLDKSSGDIEIARIVHSSRVKNLKRMPKAV